MYCSTLTARPSRWLGLGLSLTLCLLTSSAAAQYTAPRWAHPASSTGRTAPGGYTSSGSFFIAVPIAMNVDRDVVRPGASLEGRFGIKLGWFTPEVELGFAWVPINLEDEVPGAGRDPLKRFFFGIGFRLQPPTANKVIPYLSAALDFNWWNYKETDYGCGWWYCTSYDRYRFTPGISGRLGVSIRPRPMFGIDLGLGIGMSFAGDFFAQNEWWFSPFAGFSVYH